ncbi:hypothetical protein TruAng_012238 [Truncatella angustata]|nr:hypothetical protein TruAng_012238 [Truncatella angustata]
MPNIQGLSTLRARSYVLRLPLFTRAMVLIIVVLWLVGVQSVWDERQWGALIPDQSEGSASERAVRRTETAIPTDQRATTAYRINTFPLIHLNFFHMIFNVLALAPLLERFESEYGTLTSLAMFFGPLTTIPAVLYVIIERAILRSNTAVMGASLWVFLLLGVEAIRTYRTNPYLILGTLHVPTWTTPLVLTLVTKALVPSSSLLGHLCGVAVGYLFGLGYLKFLAPPEKALRWVEGRLNLLGRLPHYVSVDQKTYGRFGVLPTTNGGSSTLPGLVGSPQGFGGLS